MRNFKWLLIAVETVWVILLAFGCVAMVDVIRSYADTPNVIVNGEYVICEINTQDSALDIQEAPPIGRISEALDTVDAEPAPVYADIHITEAEGDLLARILWAEANNQCFEGQKACVEVVFNRVRSSAWPNDLVSVLSQRGQFATWKSRNKVTPTEVQYDAISEVLRETETVLPDTSYVYFDRRGVNGKNHVRIQDHVFGR